MSILSGLSASPVVVYSLRKLVDSYGGYAIRVRRSNDNAEQSIRFDTNGNVSLNSLIEDNSTSFSTWIGSNSAYVVTWFDQTTNGYNATQATHGSQPIIVNAGTLLSGITWDKVDDLLAVTAATNINNIVDLTSNFIINPVSYGEVPASGFGRVYDKGAKSAVLIGTDSTTNNIRISHNFSTTNGQFNAPINSISYSTKSLWTMKYNNSSTTNVPALYKNGTSQTVSTFVAPVGTAIADSSTDLSIGNNSATTRTFDGVIHELLWFASALSDTDRRLLETNQGDYYGITTANDLYPPSVSVGYSNIYEDAVKNNGSISQTQIVNISGNGFYTSGIAKSDVTINNLPTGLDYTITRNSDTQITINFTGNATSHEVSNNINNASITISSTAITGATSNLSTPNFSINYFDAYSNGMAFKRWDSGGITTLNSPTSTECNLWDSGALFTTGVTSSGSNTHNISGSASGSAITICELDVTSIGGVIHNISGSSTILASSTCDVVLALNVSGTSSGLASMSANLELQYNISGSSTILASSTCEVQKQQFMDGTSTSSVNTSVDLELQYNISGSSTGSANTSATLELQYNGTGSSTTTTSADGTIQLTTNITGTSTGSATTSCNLDLSSLLYVLIDGNSTSSASTSCNMELQQNISGNSISSSAATVTMELIHNITGESISNTSVLADAQLQKHITGTSAISASTSCELDVSTEQVFITITGSSASYANSTCIVQLAVNVTGSSTTITTTSGNMQCMYSISGNTSGSATTQCSIQATWSIEKILTYNVLVVNNINYQSQVNNRLQYSVRI